MTFEVVIFTVSNSTAAVPTCWVNGEECWWPPKNTNYYQLAKMKAHPDILLWAQYKVRVLKSNIASYEDADKLARKAELTSDIESDLDFNESPSSSFTHPTPYTPPVLDNAPGISRANSQDYDKTNSEDGSSFTGLTPNTPVLENIPRKTRAILQDLHETNSEGGSSSFTPVTPNIPPVDLESSRAKYLDLNLTECPSCGIPLADNQEVQLKKKDIQDIKVELQHIGSVVGHLVGLFEAGERSPSNDKLKNILSHLPLTSSEEVEDFHIRVLDKEAVPVLQHHLSMLRADSVDQLVRTILRMLFEDTVLALYS